MSVHLRTLARLCCAFAVQYREDNPACDGLFPACSPRSCDGITLGCLNRLSLLRKLLVQHRVNLTGADDEALRRRAYIVKRKARDECQIVTGRGLQYLDIIGGNDFNGFHEVIETMLGSLESDFVAQLNIAQRTEKSVTMTGQSDIPQFAGQSRFCKVTYGSPQASGGVALDHDGAEPQAGHLNFANNIAFR